MPRLAAAVVHSNSGTLSSRGYHRKYHPRKGPRAGASKNYRLAAAARRKSTSADGISKSEGSTQEIHYDLRYYTLYL